MHCVFCNICQQIFHVNFQVEISHEVSLVKTNIHIGLISQHSEEHSAENQIQFGNIELEL